MTPAEQATLSRIRAEMADILALVDSTHYPPAGTDERYYVLARQAWEMDPSAPVQHLGFRSDGGVQRVPTMAGWFGYDYAVAVEQTRRWRREHGWPVAAETQLRLEMTG